MYSVTGMVGYWGTYYFGGDFKFSLLFGFEMIGCGFFIFCGGTDFLVRKNVQYEEGIIKSFSSKNTPLAVGSKESWYWFPEYNCPYLLDPQL